MYRERERDRERERERYICVLINWMCIAKDRHRL